MAIRALALAFLATAACGDGSYPDPGFCKMAEWNVDIIQNTSVTQMGGYSLEFVSGTTGEIKTDYYPVIAGRPYRGTAWLRGSSIAAGNTGKADIEWYTGAKALISSTNIHATAVLDAANAWDEYSVIVNAPATAVFAKVCVEKVAEGGGAWTLYCDYAGIEPITPRFLAQIDAAQTVAATTMTELNFDLEVYDYGSVFDTAGHRFTAPVAGIYLVEAYAMYTTAAGQNHASYIFVGKNGDQDYVRVDNRWIAQNLSNIALGGTIHLELAKDDYLEVNVYHFDNGNLDTSHDGTSASGLECRFGATLLPSY